MKREKARMRETMTFDTPHEVLRVEPDGTESYHHDLSPGSGAWVSNYVAYTQVFEASKVLGGQVCIRPLEAPDA